MRIPTAACWNPKLDEHVLGQFDIRQQLNEQLKWLDTRVDSQASIVTEIQEYFRRRAEVEIEYSKQLDKLAKQLLLKHKSEKPKREQWHLFSSYQCWLQLINTTRKQSSDHAKVAEVYQNHLTSRLLHAAEDVQRVYRKCRNIGIDEHEELLKILHELHTTMKTYHSYWALEQQAASKLAVVESNLNKLEQGLPKDKVAKSRRYRLLNKERLKRWEKSEEARVKALKARNDYVLCVEAANAAVQKYFVDDVSDLIDAMDFGFHTSLSRCLLMYNSTLECQHKSLKGSQDAMKKCLETLDSRADKQKFLESYNTAFMAPPKFTFQTHKGDVASLKVVNVDRAQVQVEDAIFEDMEQRFRQLQNRLSDLKIENEEVWKTLETAEKTLMNMIESRNYDMSPHFDSSSDQPQVSILNSAVPSSIGGHSMEFKMSLQSNLIPKTPETAAIKLRADKQETEDFYLEKFREYSTQCSIIARLQARYDCMENALTKTSGVERVRSNCGAVGPPKRPRRKRIGRQAVTGQPKLFGGSLEEYAEATNQDIPLIIRSCIRVINLYGLHHQGVFRVSGSQVEINNFREAFERGEDPLADISDASDINSVAGVLKLYLRELREPLFPIFFFDQLMEISQLTSKEREKEFISRAKDVVKTLPRPSFAVLRFLFAFLNHLSELSDENMMCPYNLAICFGPTLLPIPEDKNPVQYQPLVNELIKGLIIHQEEIFPASEYGGILYEKYISSSEDQPPEDLDSPSDVSQTNITLETEEPLNNTDDDLVNDEPEISINLFGKEDVLEVVAQYDFTARHQRELSFKRGDVIHLTEHLSADWWKGSLRGQQGLVPDKYIMLNIRDENRDGSQRDKTSSSSDSLGSPSSQREPNSTTSTKSANSPNGSLSSLTAEPRFRRRSLSPSSTGDRSPGQPSPATMSLKRRLRATASVGDAAGDSSSSPSSSLEEGSPLTGAISRLRRQSPIRGHRQPTAAPQRRGIHGDFESSANLARDLSEALNDVINNLNVSNDQGSEPEAVPEQAVAVDTPIVVKSLKKDAPDLVQDLPPASGGSSGGEDELDHVAPSQAPDAVFIEKPQNTNLLTTESRSQNLSTAERFAMTNQCTMRKGSPRPSARNATHVVVLKGSSSASTSPQSTLQSTPPPNGNPARRSSCGSVSPILSITGQSPSVQKLKRMFSEPDRTQGPPLSPKPALKAKPVTLLKLNSRKHPPVSPRAAPPKNQDLMKEVSPLENDLIVREYRQTSC